jgi:hypothetical protein
MRSVDFMMARRSFSASQFTCSSEVLKVLMAFLTVMMM